MVFVMALVAWALVSVAEAQTRLGGVAALNLAKQEGDFEVLAGNSIKVLPRIGAGAVIEYAFDRQISFVSEPMCLGKGAKVAETVLGVTAEGEIALSYLEVPLFIKYSFGSRGARPYLLAGPTLGIKMNAKATLSLSGAGLSGSASEDISDDVKSTDLGLGLGGGIALPVGGGGTQAFVEAQYVLGLQSIETDSDVNTKNKGFQIRVGLTFPLGGKKKTR
jgi:hypothetical protein